MNDAPHFGQGNGTTHDDFAPVWDAVCEANPILIEHITGPTRHDAIGLDQIIRAFHAHAVRLHRGEAFRPDLLLAMFERFPKGAFASRVGTEIFARDVAQLCQRCIDEARERRRKEAEEAAALGIWDAGDDHDTPPPRGWLLGAIFCRQFMSSLLADGGVGKTAVRLVQLISLAIGRSLTGEHVFQRCRVLILSLEDSRDELRRRVKAVLRHFNLSPADVKGFLFLGAPKGIRLAEMKDNSPVIGPLKVYLENAIRTHRLDIISLDPFVKTHALPENSNDAIDWVCTIAAEMAIEHDIAFDSPHHTSKGLNATPGDANRGRGATAQKDAGRLVYTLTPMSTEEAKEFSVPEAERRSLIRMDNAKVNIAPPSTEAKWFRLVSVPLDNATPQYPKGDHIQVAEPWTPPKTWEGLHHPLLNIILDDIEAGMENGRRYSNGSAATDRAAWRVVQNHASEKSEKQCRDIIAAWLRSGTLFTADYDDPVTRKTASGLRVNAAKRPS
jgi:hypothetical protein